jgi:hypothetical protein
LPCHASGHASVDWLPWLEEEFERRFIGVYEMSKSNKLLDMNGY